MRFGFGISLAGHSAPWVWVEPPAQELLRAASSETDASVWSGHSLTDAVYFSGTFPGDFSSIWTSVFGGDSPHRKSTIAGSSLAWRWANSSELVPGISVDERDDIADFDLQVITEAGPPPRPGVPGSREALGISLEHLFLFVENAYLNGAETMIHTINPYWEGSYGLGFRESCVSYERTFHYMADHAADRMRREYPELPDDYRIWILPCHRLWMRLFDDLEDDAVPGYTQLEDLFTDDIHPTAPAGYGLACLAFAVIYQQDPSTIPNFFVPSGMSVELRDYFWTAAWEIATTYQRAGLGGDTVGELGYTHGTEIDPTAVPVSVASAASITPSSGEANVAYTLNLAEWEGTAPITSSYTLTLGGVDVTSSVANTGGVLTYTPATNGVLELTCTADNLAFIEAESVASAAVGSSIPADALALITASDADGSLTFSPALAAASAGRRRVVSEHTITLSSGSPVYVLAVLRPDLPQPQLGVEPIFVAHGASSGFDWWMGDNIRFRFNPWTLDVGLSATAEPGGSGTQIFGALEEEWMMLEWSSDLTSHTGRRDEGSTAVATTPRALTGLTKFSLLAGGSTLTAWDLAALIVMDRVPDAGELTAIRGWAAEIMAGL